MGMTIAEKIIAKAADRARVEPGEVVRAKPCFTTSHDFYTYPRWANRLSDIGVKRLKHPDKVVIVADHFIPAVTIAQANNHRGLREWAQRFNVKYFYYGEGISHQIQAEKGHALPGEFLASDDFDCPPLGGIGCFAVGIGTGVIESYALGEVWLRVPPSIQVRLDGQLQRGVTVRDLSQRVIGDIGDGGALYSVVEFKGPAIEQLSIDERMSLCGRIVYTGAKTAIINPDAQAIGYAQSRAKALFDPVVSDDDARYSGVMRYDLSTIEPTLAAPPAPVNSQPVSKLKGTRINQAFIGSCSGGRYEEFRAAAQLLRGKRIHPGVRLIVTPASSEILKRLGQDNLLSVFIDAGAVVGSPGCGACFGSYGGVLGNKDICISTSTNNVPGRMGSHDAQIYLGSAFTVAASAIAGEITDPRDHL